MKRNKFILDFYIEQSIFNVNQITVIVVLASVEDDFPYRWWRGTTTLDTRVLKSSPNLKY